MEPNRNKQSYFPCYDQDFEEANIVTDQEPIIKMLTKSIFIPEEFI